MEWTTWYDAQADTTISRTARIHKGHQVEYRLLADINALLPERRAAIEADAAAAIEVRIQEIDRDEP